MSLLRYGVFVLVLSGFAMACADTTAPVAPVVEQNGDPLPSLTWQGADGPRTATLLGTAIVLENGERIAIDLAAAQNFRRMAMAMPRMEALAQRMAPMWAKMGLPTPTSEVQARVALAALRARIATPAGLDGVLALTVPIDKPTLIAECDPTMQFCGFDGGNDPVSGGSGGSGGGAGGGGTGPCEGLGLMLYSSIARWRTAVSYYDFAITVAARCKDYYGLSSATMCESEASRVSAALSEMIFTTYQMQTIAQSMQALRCI